MVRLNAVNHLRLIMENPERDSVSPLASFLSDRGTLYRVGTSARETRRSSAGPWQTVVAQAGPRKPAHTKPSWDDAGLGLCKLYAYECRPPTKMLELD